MYDSEKLILLEAAAVRLLSVIDDICGGLEGGAFCNCGEGMRDCKPGEEETQCPYESAREALEMVLSRQTNAQKRMIERDARLLKKHRDFEATIPPDAFLPPDNPNRKES